MAAGWRSFWGRWLLGRWGATTPVIVIPDATTCLTGTGSLTTALTGTGTLTTELTGTGGNCT